MKIVLYHFFHTLILKLFFLLSQAAQKGFLPTSRPIRGGRGGIRGNVGGMRGGGFSRGGSVYSRGRVMRGGFRGRGRGGSYGSPG